MELLAESLAEEGVTTIRFEFPYMEKRREDGRKRPPDRQPALLEQFRKVISDVCRTPEGAGGVFVGGKSMGGRMASLVAATPEVADNVLGAVCFGYPFHPPGKPDRWRTAHFQELQRPILIIQGTRDPFGRKYEVEERRQAWPDRVNLQWLEGGEHDYRPLKKQGDSQAELVRKAAQQAAAFIRSHC